MPVIVCRERLDKLQKRAEFVRVKAACSVLPVHEAFRIHCNAVLQHLGLGVILVEDGRALGQLAERVVDVGQRPGVISVHDLAEADGRGDAEVDGQLIELAVGLQRLVQRLRHKLIARIFGVRIDIRPQVFQ